MAVDLFTGRATLRDWSVGASDLPHSWKGYESPEKWWKPEDMERKLAEIMSKPKGFFDHSKPTRAEAIPLLAEYMKKNRIAPMSVSGEGIGAEVGSILLTAKDRTFLANKIDDARYDMRNIRRVLGLGLLTLAGGFTFLGISEFYKAKMNALAEEERRQHRTT